MSPSPRRLADVRKKNSFEYSSVQTPHDAPTSSYVSEVKVERDSLNNGSGNDGSSKYENTSDNGSEISDEGYRSLGIQSNSKKIYLHNQVSFEDAETNGKH